MKFSMSTAIKASWAHLRTEWRQFIRLAWIWMAFGLLGFFAQELAPKPLEGGWKFALLLSALGQLAAGVIFAVAWHRTILAEERLDGWLPVRVSRFEGGYLWKSVQFGLIAMAPMLLFMAVAGGENPEQEKVSGVAALAALAMMVAIVTMMVRFGLVFPAAAAGQQMSFKESWQATRGHGFKLLGGILLTSLPLQLLAELVGKAAMGWTGAFGLKLTGTLVAGAFTQLVSYGVLALVTGFLSYAYQTMSASRNA